MRHPDDCPLHDCSLCGRHLHRRRIMFRYRGKPVCVRCVDANDLYDDLDQQETTTQ